MRTPFLKVCGVALAGVLPLVPGAAESAPPTPSAAGEQQAPPLRPAFAPGWWVGRAVGTGGITTAAAAAAATEPFIINFEFDVAADGTVTRGTWEWYGEIAVITEASDGTFAMAGEGTLSGRQNPVILSGTINVAGSITTNGMTVDVGFSEPASAQFAPSWASCTIATGDLAVTGRMQQQSAGVGTSVRAPFTARMLARPNDDRSVEETYSTLVADAEALLASTPPVDQEAIYQLGKQIAAWQRALLRAAQCGGATPNLAPGTHANTYLIEVFGALVGAAAADPNVTWQALYLLASIAVEVGVIGSAAPDAASAAELKATIEAALAAAIQQAIADGDQEACTGLKVAAATVGASDLVLAAGSCAG